MKLKEIFDQLSYGVLSQISVGGQPQGEINPENYSRILAFVNLGLNALHKRFNIREERLILHLQPDKYLYKLHSKFDQNNLKSKEAVKYLEVESGEPFMDDILKILRVYVDSREELSLNLKGDPLSVHTPNLTSVQVPKVIVDKGLELDAILLTDTLEIEYRADHPKLVMPLGYFDPSRVEVQLPDSYLQALSLFVAALVHTPMGIQGEGLVGNNWYGKYEAECARLEAENIEVDDDYQNTRLERGGWV